MQKLVALGVSFNGYWSTFGCLCVSSYL